MAIRKLGKWMMVPVAAVTVGAATIVVAAAAPVGDAADTPTALVQHVECTAPTEVVASTDPQPVTAASDTAAAVGQVVVKTSITPMVWLEVDEAGRLIAAATNTGCAPRSGEDMVVRRPDRSVVKDASIDLDSVQWVGDFTHLATLLPQSDHVAVGA